MKKLINLLMIVFLLVGFLGCSNAAGPDEPIQNENKEETNDKNENNEDYVPIETVTLNFKDLPNVSSVRVWRRNVTKKETDYSYRIMIHGKNKKSVTDYFLNSKEEYEYKITYYDENNDSIDKEEEIKTVKVENGLGELRPVVSATFDENSAIMHFNQKPEYYNQINNYIENTNKYNQNIKFSKNINLNYNCEKLYNNRAMMSNIEGKDKIDCSYEIGNLYNRSEEELKEIYGKPINLFGVEAAVHLLENVGNSNDFRNTVSYTQIISASELKDVPQTITVKDTRLSLPVEATTQGVKITIPQDTSIENYESIYIERSDVENGDNRFQSEVIYVNKNKGDFIDYFVDPTKTYRYKCYFQGKKGETIKSTKYSNDISGENGLGELTLDQNTTVTYDEKTGIMKFTPVPTLQQKIDKIEATDKKAEISVILTNDQILNRWVSGEIDLNNGEINWPKCVINNFVDYEKVYGVPLNFNRIDINSEIDGVKYRQYFYDFRSFPAPITIPDVREPLNVEQAQNGIKIIFPNDLPANATNFTIDRKNIQNPERYFNNYIDVQNKDEVIDYFVEPGKEYQYKLKYFSNGKWYDTPSSQIVTANKGISELDINSNGLSVTYNESTGIMNFNSLQDYTTLLQNFYNIDVGNNDKWLRIGLQYQINAGNDGDKITGWLDTEHTEINWINEIKNNNPKFFDQDLNFQQLHIQAKLGNNFYNTYISKDIMNSRFEAMRINVHDNRGTLNLETTSEGIKIFLPNVNIENNKVNCWMIRRKVGANEWNSISVNLNKLKEKNKWYITDYFVENGAKYEYRAVFEKWVGGNQYWETIMETKFSTSAQVWGGYGELDPVSYEDFIGQYNESNSTLTYNSISTFSPKIQNLISQNKAVGGFRIGYGYYDENGNGHQYDRFIIKNSQTVDYGSSFNAGENRELDLHFVEGRVETDEVWYTKLLPIEKFSNLPQRINVKGTNTNNY